MVECVNAGITSQQGLIAHGRGEAFDYLMGERTLYPSFISTMVAVAMLLLARRPVLSVNGNVAALVPEEIVELCKIVNAKLEVNLFHRSEERIKGIKNKLEMVGARNVLIKSNAQIEGIKHERSKTDREGIYCGDVILIPLEDGDRCKALVDMGKRVIAIDLNPLSRTSQTATVTIADNIIRTIPNMILLAKAMKGMGERKLRGLVASFDNKKNLSMTVSYICCRLAKLANLDRFTEGENVR
jgi:4-phosphopantoate--beta-alanine ligase